jgi:N6-adenosine-specific RNA methylase IME4
MRYRTIVVDPPWDHKDGTGVTVSTGKVTALPYQSMTLDEIAALPVKSLATNVDQDAHLYLWTTSRYLRDAFDIARGWGFHYAATLVWCKQPRGFSVGGVFQNNVEFCLFCRWPKITTRQDAVEITSRLADLAAAAGIGLEDVNRHVGTKRMAMWWLSRTPTMSAVPSPEQWQRLREFIPGAKALDADVERLNATKGTLPPRPFEKATSRWYEWPRGEHSAKPEAFIDLVEQVSPGPYVELFARRARFGWDYWGNESLGTAEMAG